jgi:hypothetical protein
MRAAEIPVSLNLSDSSNMPSGMAATSRLLHI